MGARGTMHMTAGRRTRQGGSFLGRLARDRRGNTLALVGASLIPLIGMIGSGVDISRTYMAHTRLQQACDAGALAGRRAMTDGTVDAGVRAEALKFFNFNFPAGADGVDGSAWFGARGFVPTIGSAANNTVTVSASTVMPTTIMKMFGYSSLPIAVDCNARLDFVNTDIVLVLDTTGSMLCAPSEASCTESTTKVEKSTAKIKALREGVLSFYDVLKPIQTQLDTAGLRLRYSVVPYASSINVGRVLRGVNTDYVVSDTWDYRSRYANYKHVETGVTSTYCDDVDGKTSARVGSGASETYTCTYTNTSQTGGTTTFASWTYGLTSYDVSSYATGKSTPTSSEAGTATTTYTKTVSGNPAPASLAVSSTWAGCIEERESTSISSTASSIPAAAKDLNIDLMPTDKASRWRPYWPEIEYLPTNAYEYLGEKNKPQWACPTEAKRLQVWERDELSDYLDTLEPDGGTYHDNGMIWGIRMLSSTGVFAADNPSSYRGMPVARYMIFMTDGQLDTGYSTLYTTYGIESLDKRVGASSESDQEKRHRNRFNLLCTAAKARGISVWVVAFAVSLDTSLSSCASNSNQASTSANQAQLNDRFRQIGQNIGALRLTQ